MTEKEFTQLLQKYKDGTLNNDERVLLESWYIHQSSLSEQEMSQDQVAHSMDVLRTRLPLLYPKPARRLWATIAAAAAAILILSTALWFYTNSSRNPFDSNKTQYANDIPPGKNSATLTLANGRKIDLSAAGSGKLVAEGGVTISKNESGQLIYEISNDKGTATNYNTVSTSNGEEVQVLLSDGSIVWLNAGSTLRFPTKFRDMKTREVSLTGEGYFEVAKNKDLPFILHAGSQNVKVLGTHFNVNSYPDENSAKTTLLEGSIQINGSTILKPGDQASLTQSGVIVRQVDPELATAWKNNKFMFDNQDIKEIMNMIRRWYNIEVVYVGEVSGNKFSGAVSRFTNISKVLDLLQLTGGVTFKIEGRRVTVMK